MGRIFSFKVQNALALCGLNSCSDYFTVYICCCALFLTFSASLTTISGQSLILKLCEGEVLQRIQGNIGSLSTICFRHVHFNNSYYSCWKYSVDNSASYLLTVCTMQQFLSLIREDSAQSLSRVLVIWHHVHYICSNNFRCGVAVGSDGWRDVG